jgi:cytochrome c
MSSVFSRITRCLLLLCLSAFPVLASGQQPTSTVDGIYTAEQAARGETIYNEACIACHGLDLGGNSNSPGLVGMGFMFLWEGSSVGEFFRKIQAEMPTDRPGQLPAQDYLDVIAYILQKNSFAEGSAELPSTAAALDSIVIEAGP